MNNVNTPINHTPNLNVASITSEARSSNPTAPCIPDPECIQDFTDNSSEILTSESSGNFVLFSDNLATKEAGTNLETIAASSPAVNPPLSETDTQQYDFRFLVEEYDGENKFLYIGQQYELDEARQNLFCHAATNSTSKWKYPAVDPPANEYVDTRTPHNMISGSWSKSMTVKINSSTSVHNMYWMKRDKTSFAMQPPTRPQNGNIQRSTPRPMNTWTHGHQSK